MEMQMTSTDGERSAEAVEISGLIEEAKPEGEAEPHHYCKLQSPCEDGNIYDTPVRPKADEQTGGNARLYRAVCVFLTTVCLVLLLIVIILSVRLQTGSPVCPEREQVAAKDWPALALAPTWSLEQCQAHFPDFQPQVRHCAAGWLQFGRLCFFLSTFRLSWEESQRSCRAKGGSLALISSPGVQRFLTEKGKLQYWIGLKRNGDTWTWINNAVLHESYWAEDKSDGDCGILSGGNPPEKNWVTAPCTSYTYYICQQQLPPLTQ